LQLAAGTAPESIILTTDAVAVLAPSWIEKNVREMQAGAEVVCGMAEIHRQDAVKIPRALQEDDERETFLLSILDEMTSLMNPDPYDPLPRHQQQSGASIAMRCNVLQLAGGPPHVASCEDRILIERLRLIDARIRHSRDITVQVSGRLEGRAPGGMAETIKRRMSRQDELTDAKLEPAVDALRRAEAQARLRSVRQGHEDSGALARDLLIAPAEMRALLRTDFHGVAWAGIQASSPVLRRRRVAFADLPREIRFALDLRGKLLEVGALAGDRQLTSVMPDA
jgi:hypothetical protein